MERGNVVKLSLSCLPDVISDVVVAYDYHFVGSPQDEIQGSAFVNHLSSFPDGRIVAIIGASVLVFDPESLEVVFTLQARESSGIRFEVVKGKFLVGHSCQVDLFDSHTYACLAIFKLRFGNFNMGLLDFNMCSTAYCVLQMEEGGVDVIRIVNSGYHDLFFFVYEDTQANRAKSPLLVNSTNSIELEQETRGVSKLDEKTVVVVVGDSQLKALQFVDTSAEVVELFSGTTEANLGGFFLTTAAIPNGIVFAGGIAGSLGRQTSCLVWFENMRIVKHVFIGGDDIHRVLVLPGTRRAVVCCREGSISLWNLHTGEKEFTFCEFVSWGDMCDVLPNNDLAITHREPRGDKLLFIYDTTTGDMLTSVCLHELESNLGATYFHEPGGLSFLGSGKLACSVQNRILTFQ